MRFLCKVSYNNILLKLYYSNQLFFYFDITIHIDIYDTIYYMEENTFMLNISIMRMYMRRQSVIIRMKLFKHKIASLKIDLLLLFFIF